jgi:hypothetical protein
MPDLKFILSLSLVGTLVGVVIGWLLKEISEVLRLRREDRRVIGRVLVDLVEIKYRVFDVKKISDELIERFKIPTQDQLAFQSYLESFLSNLENLHRRYEENVNAIASIYPFLGFQLRFQDLLVPYMSQLRSFRLTVPVDATSLTTLSQWETKFLELVKPEFESLIYRLAKLHSWKTRSDARHHIKTPPKLPSELEEIISHMTNERQKS